MNIPLATYRIQFNADFGFQNAQSILDYLVELGITHIYASPIFKSRKGSMHGYDIVDPQQLNPELGSLKVFEQLMQEVKNHGLRWIQDIVPNHMAYSYDNLVLRDVLENGRNSEFYNFFDVEWDHYFEGLKGRLLAPFLGRFYGECLEDGGIRLSYQEAGFAVNYFDLKFPLKIESYLNILARGVNQLKNKLGEEHQDYIKLLGILYVLRTLASSEEVFERYGEIQFIKRMLWELYTKNPDIRRFIEDNIATLNGKKGDPESFQRLDQLLSEQLFRLSFWKVATEEVNYRRFFAINDLISLKIEEHAVFNHTHSLIFKLIEEGKIGGLRIDHIDGLYDPTQYLNRVKEKTEQRYLIIEKILELEEELPDYWPVHGTTGYEFLNYVNGLFCKKENEKRFNNIYTNWIDDEIFFEKLVVDKKRLLTGRNLIADVDNLAHTLRMISVKYRHGKDLTIYGLRRAIVEIMVQFPVYRTYISSDRYDQTDRLIMETVFRKVNQAFPDLLYELKFLEEIFLFKFWNYLTEDLKKEWIHAVMKFQQFTGPLMAKAFEDTLLYVYNRFLSLNEVGGNPNIFGIGLNLFHEFIDKRLTKWPHSMNASSTHDTKRGEDVRARLNVLSELPQQWEQHLKEWNKMNSQYKKIINGNRVPDRNDEYFLYQTLLGAFPFDEKEYPEFIQRIKEYIIKAVREAKVHTTWLKPDTEYEEAYISFLESLLTPEKDNAFLKSFLPFKKKIAFYGILNSLSQTLIKITSPGVPDFYQGTELFCLSLVDPDNRRAVDFEQRKSHLWNIRNKAESDTLGLIEELLSTMEDGKLKLFLIHKSLHVRKEKRELFQNGTYIGLKTGGKHKDFLVSFARKYQENWAITVAPRFITNLVEDGQMPLGEKVWQDTYIGLPKEAPSEWKNGITGELIRAEKKLPVSQVLSHFPVALLI
jgi:(1->4)-alpha-D-glucan 1-alpha-D-glucosylmutase